MTTIGFHVWNPAGRLPTYTHDTFLQAWAEKDRLQAAHPGERFVVMMPCEDMSAIGYGLGFTRGREEGLAQAHREIMKAEAITDRLHDEMHALKAAKALIDDVETYQATVADCQCWFNGFGAAFAVRESYERPSTPSADKIRDLNIALQAIWRERDKAAGRNVLLDDQDIPF